MDICNLETEVRKQQDFLFSLDVSKVSVREINVSSSGVRIAQVNFKEHEFASESRDGFSINLFRLFIVGKLVSDVLLFGALLEEWPMEYSSLKIVFSFKS
jgi:hypothetical protein